MNFPSPLPPARIWLFTTSKDLALYHEFTGPSRYSTRFSNHYQVTAQKVVSLVYSQEIVGSQLDPFPLALISLVYSQESGQIITFVNKVVQCLFIQAS